MKYEVGTITDLTTSWKEISLGFVPSIVILMTYNTSDGELSFIWNVKNNNSIAERNDGVCIPSKIYGLKINAI